MRSTIHAVNRMPTAMRSEKDSDEMSIQSVSVRRMSGSDTIKNPDDRRHHVEGDSQMSRNRSNSSAANVPAALRPAKLRAGLVLAVIAAMAAFAVRVHAEQVPTPATLSMVALDSGK